MQAPHGLPVCRVPPPWCSCQPLLREPARQPCWSRCYVRAQPLWAALPHAPAHRAPSHHPLWTWPGSRVTLAAHGGRPSLARRSRNQVSWRHHRLIPHNECWSAAPLTSIAPCNSNAGHPAISDSRFLIRRSPLPTPRAAGTPTPCMDSVHAPRAHTGHTLGARTRGERFPSMEQPVMARISTNMHATGASCSGARPGG